MMLKIAVVANDFASAKRFVEWKFAGKIDKIVTSTATYHLKNGDVIYLCYDERGRNSYNSMIFDAFLVEPSYESLLDVIRHRTNRPS